MATENLKRVKSSDLELLEKVVGIQRVAKVTKGGRTFSFTAIVVVGDSNGIVGHGLGKAGEVIDAIQKGIEDAKKNLIKIPIINGTVPHEQYGKYGGGYIFLKPAASWYGCYCWWCDACCIGECWYNRCTCKIKRFLEST